MEQTSRKETECQSMAMLISFNIYNPSASVTAEIIGNNETTDLTSERGNLSLIFCLSDSGSFSSV